SEQRRRGIGEDPPAGRGGNISVPQRRSASHQRTVPLQPNVYVVEQRLDRTDIQDTESAPPCGQYAREDREERRFRFPSSSRSENDQMFSGKNRRDDRILERAQLTPPQTIHDVMLQGGMERLKGAHSAN